VCALGALETEIINPLAPYTVDGKYTQNLIRAAAAAPSVKHFVLITSLGTAKWGWPAGVLNLFWGVLKWKRASEVALQESGLPYTIVRPGGMERPTDEYELTHNVKLCKEDTTFGGQVSLCFCTVTALIML
jgi:NAD(P)H-binding